VSLQTKSSASFVKIQQNLPIKSPLSFMAVASIMYNLCVRNGCDVLGSNTGRLLEILVMEKLIDLSACKNLGVRMKPGRNARHGLHIDIQRY